MSLAILFHFLCAQNVSDINTRISIMRSLRLFCWIITLVVLFLVRCVLGFGVVRLEWYPCCRLQPATRIPLQPNHTETCDLRLFCWITTLVVLFLVQCVLEFRCDWVGVVSVLQAAACNTDTTPTQPHRNSNTHWTKNNTTNVVIQQNSHKFLMIDILKSETCWAHKKWNKIASDIKLVFHSSTITMMHGPINISVQLFHVPKVKSFSL